MRAKPLFALLASVLVGLVASTASAADAEKGKQIFDRRCQICHSMERGVNKLGPSLAGVVGSKAGSVSGYNYSEALQDSDIVWTEHNLDQWLANPHQFIPGDKMPFPGLKSATERQDVLAYLRGSK
jgi:cytochrome c2